jgi:hypothetical protein
MDAHTRQIPIILYAQSRAFNKRKKSCTLLVKRVEVIGMDCSISMLIIRDRLVQLASYAPLFNF